MLLVLVKNKETEIYMNIKLIIKAIGIILINILLSLLIVSKFNLPYTSSMFLFTVFTILLWFFLLRRDIPITINAIDKKTRVATLALFLIPIATSIITLSTASSVDYGILSFLFVTSFLIAVNEEILFRVIGLGGLLHAGLSPVKAITISSILFGLAHLVFLTSISTGMITLFLNSVAMGFILGYLYFKTQNIVFVIAIHIVWDIAVFINQRVANQDTGLLVTILLLATTVVYLIWSLREIKKGSK